MEQKALFTVLWMLFDTTGTIVAPNHDGLHPTMMDVLHHTLCSLTWQLYLHWLDSKNYLELTRTWYCKTTMFPLTLILLSWKHRQVSQQLTVDQPAECTPEQRKIEVQKWEIISVSSLIFMAVQRCLLHILTKCKFTMMLTMWPLCSLCVSL